MRLAACLARLERLRAGASLANQDISFTNYDPNFADIQRQQRLADLLSQQASAPIDINSGGGVQAPINPLAILAKAFQGYAGSYLDKKADQKAVDLQTQRRADLAKMLSTQFQTPAQGVQQTEGTPAIPANNIPNPMGGAPLAMPAQPGIAADPSKAGISDARAKTPQEQMASALAMMGSGNPYAAQMAPQLYGMAANRDEKTWENAQPMSAAATQQIAAQGAQAQSNAKFENQLKPTQYQQEQIALDRGKLGEERRYHDLLSGAGIGGSDPMVANWVDAVAKGNVPGIQAVPKRYQDAVAAAIKNAPQEIFAPIAGRRFGMESNSIVGPMMKLPQYELTAQGLPYIQRIQAALKNPGSVSDQELLDSFTKLSTAGNAITDAQVRIITDGKSLSDWANVLSQKLGTGGVLSPAQRDQISKIANATYSKYREGYQPLYDEATSKLQAAGIPKAFWTIPDLNKLNAAQTGGGNAPAGANIAPAGTKATGPGGKVLTSDGKGGWN